MTKSLHHRWGGNPILKEKPDLINLVNATLSEFLTKGSKDNTRGLQCAGCRTVEKGYVRRVREFSQDAGVGEIDTGGG